MQAHIVIIKQAFHRDETIQVVVRFKLAPEAVESVEVNMFIPRKEINFGASLDGIEAAMIERSKTLLKGIIEASS